MFQVVVHLVRRNDIACYAGGGGGGSTYIYIYIYIYICPVRGYIGVYGLES